MLEYSRMSTAPTQFTIVGRKIAALDGIRGVAILLVLFNHYNRFIPDGTLALQPLKSFFEYGWTGVDLFFALSGFLITGILLETRAANNYFKSFYARRILRIFPIYYLTLLVVFGAVSWMSHPPSQVPVAADRKLYFFYLTNWLFLWKGTWGPNVVGHFWSLAVEEQFYLLWPVFVLYFSRRRLKTVSLLLCAVALIVRVLWVWKSGPSVAVAISSITRMDSLLAGGLAAILAHEKRGEGSNQKGLWLFVAPLAAFTVGVLACRGDGRAEIFYETIGYTLLALGFASLIFIASLPAKIPGLGFRILGHPFFTQLGKYSYGIYVFHVPLLGAFELTVYRRLPSTLVGQPAFALLYCAIACILTFFVAKISYECLERRFLAWKRYFEPSFSEGATVKQAAHAVSLAPN
jgi:peptidoglycan/LPS O-acetylase OafA/YrhL